MSGLADGIVVTPSHNPPEDGGFKYNPPNGGPADTHVTGWIQDQANALLADRLAGVKRMPVVRRRCVIGIVSSRDLMRVIASGMPDAPIANQRRP